MVDWSQGGQGAAGGAMAGAAFGPWGAGIGAGIGGVLGLFGNSGAQGYQDQLNQLAAGYGSRAAPQAGPAAQSTDYASNQAGLISQLTQMAQGQGPSAAAIQMRQAMDKAAASQASAAAGAGGRGVNAGAAMRNAMNNTAAVQSQGARDTSVLRSQEQMQSIGQLGSAIGQGQQNSQFNAGQQNQMSQANLQAQLQAMGINTQAQLQALQAAMGAAGPGLGAQIMAGGASAMPGLMQYQMGQQKLGQAGAPGGYSPGPVTSPSQTGMFGQYSRPDA